MADEDQFIAAPPQQQPHIYRPIPRRNFSRNSDNSNSPDPFSDPSSFPPQSQTTSQNESGPRSPGSSDFLAQLNARLLGTRNNNPESAYDGTNEGTGLKSNKSFMNLTSSTLFGIYDDVPSGIATAGPSEIQTPWGTGAETPAKGTFDIGLGMTPLDTTGAGLGSPFGGPKSKEFRRRRTIDMTEQETQNRRSRSVQRQRHGLPRLAVLLGKTIALFSFGVAYGAIVSLLHGSRELAAVSSRVGGVEREGWLYFVSWGAAGVLLGSLLPWVDERWEGQSNSPRSPQKEEIENEEGLPEQWNDIVRSVGAFVGIAFAIRKLPWQSTLQLTLTLALVNPALWYIIDRSRTGLTVSTLVTSVLTTFIFLANPDVLPSPGLPATVNSTQPLSASKQQPSVQEKLPQGARGGELFVGLVTYESLAVATWVGSVLFCSCVCFGSIGRRLAVLDDWSFRR